MMRRTVVLGFAFAVMAGCGNPAGVDGGPGFVAASIATTATGVGAIRLTITGPGIDSVDATGLTVYSGTSGANERRVILVGTIASGTELTFWIPEQANLSQYQVIVDEAAATTSYQQLNPSTFTVTLAPSGG